MSHCLIREKHNVATMPHTTLIIVVCIAALLLSLQPAAFAVQVYTNMALRGVGYLDTETRINTQTNSERGHEATISARGSGEYFNEKEVIAMDSDDQRVEISSGTEKSYTPVSYLNREYDTLLGGEITTKNYIIGVAITERHFDTLDISGTRTHIAARNRSATEIHTEILGKAHFGMDVKNIENPHHTIMRARDNYIGNFIMDKEVIVIDLP
jgi:hypothetical protein